MYLRHASDIAFSHLFTIFNPFFVGVPFLFFVFFFSSFSFSSSFAEVEEEEAMETVLGPQE